MVSTSSVERPRSTDLEASPKKRKMHGFHETEVSLQEHPIESSSNDYDSPFDNPANYPDGGWRAYLVVFGAFLGLTVDFGFINSIGAIQSYLNLHQLKDVSTTINSLIFSIFMLLTYVLCVVGGVAFDELGPRTPILVGTIILFFGMFFTGNCTSVGSFIGVFSILAGAGIAVSCSPLTGAVSHWFLKKRSKAFALATLGGSVGGIIFPLILNSLYIKVGFTWALRILAFICLALMLMSAALVSGRKNIILAADPEKKSIVKSSAAHELKVICFKTFNFSALREWPFMLCTLGIAFSDLALVGCSTYFPSFVTYIGYSETKANTTITITNCMGILGRYLPGILADKIGPYNVMIMMMAGTSLSILLLWLAWATNSLNLASIYVFSVIYGFFDSSVLSLAPSCIGAVSPTSEFGQRYGTAYLCAGIVIFGGTIGGGAIIAEETLSNYRYYAIFCGLLYMLSTCCYITSRCFQVGKRFLVKV